MKILLSKKLKLKNNFCSLFAREVKPFVQSSRRGVAIVFFVIVFGLLLGFFMMVANTGLLVYQKIRLQTAVDMAAYSAASVQASYLSNEASSGSDSIFALNQLIMERYGVLLNDMQFGWVAPWPVGLPNAASCVAACMAANIANGHHAAKLYKNAVSDIETYRKQVEAILSQLPEAAQKAAEATIRLNIPELAVGSDSLEAALSETSNKVDDLIQQNKSDGSASNLVKRKNAVLTFTSKKGMYLANVVAAVPHSFVYYGPMCFDAMWGVANASPSFYCAVNGTGSDGPIGLDFAALSFARSKANPVGSGNIGNLPSLADKSANAIRLFYIQNPHKPDPFVTVSAEWYPASGTFMNIENSLGANGTVFPTQTRLVAVAAAEPFGGSLAVLSGTDYGTRLQSIRKVLLDPRMVEAKSDFPGLYEYFHSLGPVDRGGTPIDTPQEVIKRFLH